MADAVPSAATPPLPQETTTKSDLHHFNDNMLGALGAFSGGSVAASLMGKAFHKDAQIRMPGLLQQQAGADKIAELENTNRILNNGSVGAKRAGAVFKTVNVPSKIAMGAVIAASAMAIGYGVKNMSEHVSELKHSHAERIAQERADKAALAAQGTGATR